VVQDNIAPHDPAGRQGWAKPEPFIRI